MQFCDNCGSTMVKVDEEWLCRECELDMIKTAKETDDDQTPTPRAAQLNDLPTTSSGTVRKIGRDAMVRFIGKAV